MLQSAYYASDYCEYVDTPCGYGVVVSFINFYNFIKTKKQANLNVPVSDFKSESQVRICEALFKKPTTIFSKLIGPWHVDWKSVLKSIFEWIFGWNESIFVNFKHSLKL